MKSLTLLLLLASSAGASSFQQLDLYQSSATLRVSGVIGVAASTGTPTTYRFIVNGPAGYIQFPDGTQQTTAGGGGGGASTITANAVQFSGNGSAGLPLNLNASTVTLQGNNFNSANQLVKLNGSGLAEISITGYSSSATVCSSATYASTASTATYAMTASSAAFATNAQYVDFSTITAILSTAAFQPGTNSFSGVNTFTNNVFLNGSGTGVGNLEFKGSYPHIIYFNNQSGTATSEILGQVVFDQSTSGRGVLAAFGDTHSTLPKVLYLGALTTSGMNVLISGNDNKLPDIFVSSTTGGTAGGNVGIGTSSPRSKLDIKNEGWIDGLARGQYAYNRSGSTISSGTVVINNPFESSTIDITTAPVDSEYPVGTVYDTSCVDDALCRICTEGICFARLITTDNCVAGTDKVVIAGGEVGRAECLATTVAKHNQEIGQPASYSSGNGQVIKVWAHRN